MFHLDLKLRGDTLSEYNETQPFDPYILRAWRIPFSTEAAIGTFFFSSL